MSVFSTDPSFCPHCGTILPLPGAGDIVICKLCDFQQDTSVYEGLEEYSCKYFASKKETPKLSSKGEGPLVERRCPKCGNEEMSYSTQQTRSADEGQTVFYSCPKCKYGCTCSLLAAETSHASTPSFCHSQYKSKGKANVPTPTI